MPNVTLSNIIDAIVALLEGIDGMGKVLNYSRYTPEEGVHFETYVQKDPEDSTKGLLHCWIVTRESTKSHDRGAGPVNIRDQHKIVIEGFRALQSGKTSELLHQEMAEAIRAKLHENRKLPSADDPNASAGWLSSPVQVEAFDVRMFQGAVLAWHAKLSFTAEPVLQGG